MSANVPLDEWLAIDGTPILRDGCIHIHDLAPLRSGSAQYGEDRKLPGGDVVANPRFEDITKVNLTFTLKGICDINGVEYPDERTGLALNAAWLQSLSRPTGVGDGTRTATLHHKALAELAKPVHVEGDLSLKTKAPGLEEGTLRLSFPEGLFDCTVWLA